MITDRGVEIVPLNPVTGVGDGKYGELGRMSRIHCPDNTLPCWVICMNTWTPSPRGTAHVPFKLPTSTVATACPAPPSAVSLISNVPSDKKMCFAFAPVAELPSPKFHE